MKPTELVANAIGRERERAGLSLSALAIKADLAKSTLSQLEAGKGNPSIETLWAIASALEIPFSFLFENTTTDSQLIRTGEGAELSSDSSKFSTVLLDKCPPKNRRDLYRIHLMRGSVRKAQAHPKGTIEHAFVSDGLVRLGPSGGTEEINCGDYFRYRADAAHSYEAISETATILLIMETTR
jgi:transcriptional regulator with XRE-family HTH domain